jgi:hypothetical protein
MVAKQGAENAMGSKNKAGGAGNASN